MWGGNDDEEEEEEEEEEDKDDDDDDEEEEEEEEEMMVNLCGGGGEGDKDDQLIHHMLPLVTHTCHTQHTPHAPCFHQNNTNHMLLLAKQTTKITYLNFANSPMYLMHRTLGAIDRIPTSLVEVMCVNSPSSHLSTSVMVKRCGCHGGAVSWWCGAR